MLKTLDDISLGTWQMLMNENMFDTYIEYVDKETYKMVELHNQEMDCDCLNFEIQMRGRHNPLHAG